MDTCAEPRVWASRGSRPRWDRSRGRHGRRDRAAQFATEDGRAKIDGDFRIDGVSTAGSPIGLTFIDPGGAATGRFLPTGSVRDVLDVGQGRKLEASASTARGFNLWRSAGCSKT
jgi:hypothetical protein